MCLQNIFWTGKEFSKMHIKKESEVKDEFIAGTYVPYVKINFLGFLDSKKKMLSKIFARLKFYRILYTIN